MSIANTSRLITLCILILAAGMSTANDGALPIGLAKGAPTTNSSRSIEKEVQVILGKHALCVPQQSILNLSWPSYLKEVEDKLPRSTSVGLLITAKEAAGLIDGFQAYDGSHSRDLRFLVELLDEADLAAYLDPEMHVYSDSWYGRGLMANRVVEPHESGLYKVQAEGINVFWNAVKIHPDASKPPPRDPFSWYMASCSETTSPLTATGNLTSCTTMFVYDDLRFSVSFNGKNLAVVEDIRALLIDRFRSYVVDEQNPVGN